MGLRYVRDTTELDLQRADLGVFLEIQEGLDELPEFRGQDDLVPFRSGRLVRDRWADGRRILLAGIIDDELPANLRSYVDEVKAALDPGAGPGVLVAELEDGTSRWIRVTPTSLIAPRLGPNARRVSVELSAFDPFWYGQLGILTMDSGLAADDGYVLDASADIVVSSSDAQTIDLDLPGSADCERISIRMTGPSTDAVGIQTDEADPVGFVLGRALLGGEELLVDVFARSIAIDGENVRGDTQLLSGNRYGRWLRVRPGSSRLLILGSPAECRVNLTPTYT